MNHLIRLSLFSLLLFINSLTAQAQKKFSFGARVATSKDFVTPSYTNNYLRLGYSIGALTEYSITKNLALRAEIDFVKTGYGYKANYTDMTGHTFSEEKMKFNFYYLNVPVMAKISFGEKVKPYFLLGSWAGICLGGNQINPDFKIPGSTTQAPRRQAIHPQKFNAGIIGGFGIDIKPIFVELKTNVALTAFDAIGTKLSTLELGVGVRF